MKVRPPSGFVLMLLLGGGAVHPASPVLLQSVIAGGGGVVAGGTSQIHGTLGQPVVGTFTASPADAARIGFWSQVTRWLAAPPHAGTDLLERRPGESATILRRILLANDRSSEWTAVQWLSVDPVSAQGGTLFEDGPWIIYQPAPGLPPNADDSFGYRVIDPEGGTATGMVLVRTILPPGSDGPNALGIETLAGTPDRVRVRFQGIPFRTYSVEVAGDPAGPWTGLTSLVAAANGVLLLEEPSGPEPRFYRLVEPPLVSFP